MLVESIRRLSEFAMVDSYRYIGFGSTYFSDFILFHKSLGIRNMISIERDISNRPRFEFNRPYNCIRMLFGESSELLPTLAWNTKTILWLVYAGSLESYVLTHFEYFCAISAPRNAVIVD